MTAHASQPRVLVHIHVDPDMKAEIEHIAAQTGASMSAAARRLLEIGLAHRADMLKPAKLKRSA